MVNTTNLNMGVVMNQINPEVIRVSTNYVHNLKKKKFCFPFGAIQIQLLRGQDEGERMSKMSVFVHPQGIRNTGLKK